MFVQVHGYGTVIAVSKYNTLAKSLTTYKLVVIIILSQPYSLCKTLIIRLRSRTRKNVKKQVTVLRANINGIKLVLIIFASIYSNNRIKSTFHHKTMLVQLQSLRHTNTMKTVLIVSNSVRLLIIIPT